jgi:hypothetical protein
MKDFFEKPGPGFANALTGDYHQAFLFKDKISSGSGPLICDLNMSQENKCSDFTGYQRQ